jgi:hypothetical protein
MRMAERPVHYKVICISMYTTDLDDLDAKVAELKRRGMTKANRSMLIRTAIGQLDVDDLAPPLPTPEHEADLVIERGVATKNRFGASGVAIALPDGCYQLTRPDTKFTGEF